MMTQETKFLEYYRSIDTCSRPSKQDDRLFNGYTLSQLEADNLLHGLDNYKEIYLVLYILATENLVINFPELLSKLIERISMPKVGWNCLNMAIKYFGLEQTLIQLYRYIKVETIPEVLDGFFEPIARHTFLFHLWNASLSDNFTRTFNKGNELSSSSAIMFIELLIRLFLLENRCEHIYGYHLSRLICIQEKYFPTSLNYLLPELINRSEELKQKTNIKFYDFEFELNMNK